MLLLLYSVSWGLFCRSDLDCICSLISAFTAHTESPLMLEGVELFASLLDCQCYYSVEYPQMLKEAHMGCIGAQKSEPTRSDS